ncbi:hypothetical protein H0H92_001964, partial [Tricholoma furcatifolium]
MLPEVPSPTLSDLHVSLANRERLKYYIDEVKKERFPLGTGWEGVTHYKEQQDSELPTDQLYIRRIITIPYDASSTNSEDESIKDGDTGEVKMVICMTKEGSRRLLGAQYLQSDIGFKRVVSFYEFELACLDREANT